MAGLPSLGAPELFIILVIVLIVFGAGRLPQIARGLGQAVGEFRRASRGLDVEGSEADDQKKGEE
jgi:sec-independent protein translocase protein TatA